MVLEVTICITLRLRFPGSHHTCLQFYYIAPFLLITARSHVGCIGINTLTKYRLKHDMEISMSRFDEKKLGNRIKERSVYLAGRTVVLTVWLANMQ